MVRSGVRISLHWLVSSDNAGLGLDAGHLLKVASVQGTYLATSLAVITPYCTELTEPQLGDGFKLPDPVTEEEESLALALGALFLFTSVMSS